MRIVMVCRHFPPAVSGGARRPFEIARELEKAGNEVVVVAPQACPDIAVVAVPHVRIDPPEGADGPAKSLRDRLRSWVLLPDPDVRWARAAAGAALPWRPDWVVTTSPPHSIHVAGWLLKRRFGCRWAAEFRDHWLRHPLRPEAADGALRRWFEGRIARCILGVADAGIAVSPDLADEMKELGLSAPVDVIEHFADPPPGGLRLPQGAVHLVHTGSFALSDLNRSIEPLLGAFEKANNAKLRLHLVGRLREDERRRVAASPLAARIDVPGVVPIEEARAYQAAADVLLLVAAPGTPHVPGKLAEYRAAGRPVLAFGDGPWCEAAGISPVANLGDAFAALPEIVPSQAPAGVGSEAAGRRFAAVLAWPTA